MNYSVLLDISVLTDLLEKGHVRKISRKEITRQQPGLLLLEEFQGHVDFTIFLSYDQNSELLNLISVSEPYIQDVVVTYDLIHYYIFTDAAGNDPADAIGV